MWQGVFEAGQREHPSDVINESLPTQQPAGQIIDPFIDSVVHENDTGREANNNNALIDIGLQQTAAVDNVNTLTNGDAVSEEANVKKCDDEDKEEEEIESDSEREDEQSNSGSFCEFGSVKRFDNEVICDSNLEALPGIEPLSIDNLDQQLEIKKAEIESDWQFSRIEETSASQKVPVLQLEENEEKEKEDTKSVPESNGDTRGSVSDSSVKEDTKSVPESNGDETSSVSDSSVKEDTKSVPESNGDETSSVSDSSVEEDTKSVPESNGDERGSVSDSSVKEDTKSVPESNGDERGSVSDSSVKEDSSNEQFIECFASSHLEEHRTLDDGDDIQRVNFAIANKDGKISEIDPADYERNLVNVDNSGPSSPAASRKSQSSIRSSSEDLNISLPNDHIPSSPTETRSLHSFSGELVELRNKGDQHSPTETRSLHSFSDDLTSLTNDFNESFQSTQSSPAGVHQFAQLHGRFAGSAEERIIDKTDKYVKVYSNRAGGWELNPHELVYPLSEDLWRRECRRRRFHGTRTTREDDVVSFVITVDRKSDQDCREGYSSTLRHRTKAVADQALPFVKSHENNSTTISFGSTPNIYATEDTIQLNMDNDKRTLVERNKDVESAPLIKDTDTRDKENMPLFGRKKKQETEAVAIEGEDIKMETDEANDGAEKKKQQEENTAEKEVEQDTPQVREKKTVDSFKAGVTDDAKQEIQPSNAETSNLAPAIKTEKSPLIGAPEPHDINMKESKLRDQGPGFLCCTVL